MNAGGTGAEVGEENCVSVFFFLASTRKITMLRRRSLVLRSITVRCLRTLSIHSEISASQVALGSFTHLLPCTTIPPSFSSTMNLSSLPQKSILICAIQ